MDFGDVLFCNEEILGSPCEGNNAAVDFSGDNTSDEPGLLHFDDAVPLSSIVQRESGHLPDAGYFAVLRSEDVISSARSNAVYWMMKVRNVYSFSPLTIALAVNYFDRYLSKQLLRTWKAWMIELLTVACLSLAAKMEEPDVPMLQDLQIEGLDHIFESKTIQRMEIAVMKLLGWRMGSVTPFSYIEGLLQNLDVSRNMKLSLLNRTSEVLVKTLPEMDFLAFPPSVVSLAAMSCALEELLPLRAEALKGSLAKILPTPQDQLRRCYRLMEELVVDPLCPLLSVSQVLENRKASPSPYSNGEVSQTGESYPDWDESGKAQHACSKSVKRKLDEFLKAEG
ncbi:hypothetical protein SELMODRAFT_420671 [Selaginella moellendorffii]|uniref:Uncharacterized protein CYCD2-1 n=1 Tax=Selaginella moellendorffii TaxID=88036 RepID=D8SCR3_SELML|nr:cyclin-D1-1 [Selaginella moellendorffii]EFJ17757.1 hypothetical protein SELMODRAFT_420671 [Selaginella moellendorffii]|eukprot:XP_002981056.1 cyclin-D1-1 [Selaginella moellendorffii]